MGLEGRLMATRPAVVCYVIQMSGSQPHECSNLIMHILALCKRSWVVSFHHVPWSGNKVADCLTKMTNIEGLDVRVFSTSPASIVSAITGRCTSVT
ncbi:hypothetical protein V6N11_000368 [Hibiscus sabdariffa]|uniref:RNase H type-1 domain-containing protein n=1 Tax=Hibiscus sabdariffa TaxID=183260 RepID=A0ABR2A911_9ROSI